MPDRRLQPWAPDRKGRARAGWALSFLLWVPLQFAAAQDGAERPTSSAASAPLPPTHWFVETSRRLDALGLLDGTLHAQGLFSRGEAVDAVRRARASADSARPEWAGWLESIERRLLEEFPEAGAWSEAGRRLSAETTLGYRTRHNFVAPGSGIFTRRVGTTPLPDVNGGTLALSAALRPAPGVSAFVRSAVEGSTVGLESWEIAASGSRVRASAGRAATRYGVAAGGGLLIHDATFDRVELRSVEPILLPAALRRVGPLSMHTFWTRISEPRHPGRPHLWGFRGRIRPHPRFTVSVNRAAMFGGDSIGVRTTLPRLGAMLIGRLSEDFENQIVSVDAVWRVPSDAWIPLSAYLEWGAEDAAGAWWDVPGITLGLYTPAVPGIPAVAAGIEGTRLPVHCCGNPPWYFHASFAGGWVLDDRPLGHPLGGEGWELSSYAQVLLREGRFIADVRGFQRERGREGFDHTPQRAGNLYAPERAGRSRGTDLDVRWRFQPRAELRLRGAIEAGEEWHQREFRIDAAAFF